MKTVGINRIDKHIAKRMLELRKEKQLTQKELSLLLGLSSHVNVVNMEKGYQSFTVKKIYMLCSIFNITPNDLFPEIKNAKVVKRKKSVFVKRIETKKVFKASGLPKI